jgi:hypothetical protein
MKFTHGSFLSIAAHKWKYFIQYNNPHFFHKQNITALHNHTSCWFTFLRYRCTDKWAFNGKQKTKPRQIKRTEMLILLLWGYTGACLRWFYNTKINTRNIGNIPWTSKNTSFLLHSKSEDTACEIKKLHQSVQFHVALHTILALFSSFNEHNDTQRHWLCAFTL